MNDLFDAIDKSDRVLFEVGNGVMEMFYSPSRAWKEIGKLRRKEGNYQGSLVKRVGTYFQEMSEG